METVVISGTMLIHINKQWLLSFFLLLKDTIMGLRAFWGPSAKSRLEIDQVSDDKTHLINS